MGSGGYESFSLIWQGRTIEVLYQANWLNSGHWHLELRCAEALPMTQTGYRSQFVVADVIEGPDAVEVYVHAWLDHAAEDPAWRRYVSDSRQLSLF